MPARIPQAQCLRAFQPTTPAITSILPFRPFSSTPPSQAQKKQKSRDPYVLAQAAARKAANLSRQDVLKKQREAAYGDPVKGITTPFVQSFDTGLDLDPASNGTPASVSASTSAASDSDSGQLGIKAADNERLNNFLSVEEVNQRLKDSFLSSAPLPERRSTWLDRNRPSSMGMQQQPDYDPESVAKEDQEEEARKKAIDQERNILHQQRHENAVAALAKIVSLSNGSSNDRARVNTQRCINTFGRHNTDDTLAPRPLSVPAMPRSVKDPRSWVQDKLAEAKAAREDNIKERGGPDTGSSEVQIAIMTAKIRTLSQFLETRGNGDKHGKRNLRLLVHKRQKLLKYLWKKEKGGARWQHCIETLGLTDGTWKGEISL